LLDDFCQLELEYLEATAHQLTDSSTDPRLLGLPCLGDELSPVLWWQRQDVIKMLNVETPRIIAMSQEPPWQQTVLAPASMCTQDFSGNRSIVRQASSQASVDKR
jgi:hypothetical protein